MLARFAAIAFVVCTALYPSFGSTQALSSEPTQPLASRDPIETAFPASVNGVFKFSLSNGRSYDFSRGKSPTLAMIPGARVYFPQMRRCSAPFFVYDVFYTGLAREFVETTKPQDHLRHPLLQTELICAGNANKRVKTIDVFIVHKNQILASYDAKAGSRGWDVSNRKINSRYIAEDIPAYVERVLQRDVYPLRQDDPALVQSFASIDNAETNYLRGVRSAKYGTLSNLDQIPRKFELEFVEPYFQRSLDLGYPLSHFTQAMRLYNSVGANFGSLRGEMREQFRLSLAKAVASGYVGAYAMYQKAENASIDMKTAVATVKEFGITATVADMKGTSRVESAPNEAQVGLAVQQLLLRNNCSFDRFKIQMQGLGFKIKNRRCVHSTLVADMEMGTGGIYQLQCSGRGGNYMCSFQMSLSCSVEMKNGVQASIGPCGAVRNGRYPLRGVFSRNDRGDWRVSELK